ncbi:5-formyltetrahydrofolate cyclo-ligase [Indiicoccus explosivorum]|uniref:5-formyltetrahydrofolate cyclo-ligase n=1 Tax=Indiicoccus explosivorum TaxID=1917864 RepID=UPI000B43B745|nr:5-formyltetrahydrofolate cyclo-ligase [Indiicoccus explosivorum]
MEKKEIRKRMLSALKEMELEERLLKTRKIRDRLLADPVFKSSDLLAVTVSAFPEIDTLELIEAAWRLGKRVAVPKCLPDTREMDFYIIRHFGQLETVYMELKEPVPELCEPADREEIELMIVPGVAFSEAGFRIGFGGGYYDRFLEGFTGSTYSLAFERQIVENMPNEPHDVPVGSIITESRMIRTEEFR